MMRGNNKLKDIPAYSDPYKQNDILWKYRTKGASYYKECVIQQFFTFQIIA